MTETAYVETAGTIRVPGWEIPAALTVPSSLEPGESLPSAILLVPGSLFSDVNGDYPSWNVFPHVYAHLARQLTARGHAVLRFAKLGPGTGSVPTDPEVAATIRTWDGRVTIAGAALDFMRVMLAERGLQTARTVVAGHSEGSIVASRLAVSVRAAELDGIVLLAGPSVGILGIMREQVAFGLAPGEIDDVRARLDRVIEYVRRGEVVPAELGEGPGMGIRALISMPEEGRRYMREVDATDPIDLARCMTQAVLVVQGGNDSSVPPHHGEALRDALCSRPDGGTRTSYEFVPDVTHMFKVVPATLSGPEAFGYPGETDPRVADGIDHWVRRLGAADLGSDPNS
ncbi:MAG TPA: alpha/beta fold hydrolase [Gemmatimonadaceae bacterium]|nr:alpha/beta fold hydrolase [Gemmatimonadaceae bacterium]